jgi:hypothetical protein
MKQHKIMHRVQVQEDNFSEEVLPAPWWLATVKHLGQNIGHIYFS